MLHSESSFKKILNNKIEDLNEHRYKKDNTNRIWKLIFWYSVFIYRFLLICLIIFMIKNNLVDIAVSVILYNSMDKVTDFIKYTGDLLKITKGFNLSCNRIFSIMDNKEFAKEEFGNINLEKASGNFEFKDVSFSYNENKKILNNMNFKIYSKETVAFVGKSGAGKTTIFSLLCKLYDSYDGKITIDNTEIRNLNKESIRGNITIISQNPYIFNMSIKDNLKILKNNLTDEEIKKACQMACLDEDIESLPDKYDTIVGEGGVMLSGGQKQRLAIAMAFVQETEIILFDEATSALDNKTQLQFQNAINNLRRKYTILIIAHRLSTIKNADRILFVDDGKIIAEGDNELLLSTCEKYKELYEAEIVNN